VKEMKSVVGDKKRQVKELKKELTEQGDRGE
jgi:hypothetical protein